MKKKNGFTLIELLIVTTIIAVLIIALLAILSRQLSRSRDSRRKSDLDKIKVAFEEYYNDYGCYPPTTILDNCESEDLNPYVNSVPCDPSTKTPYFYEPDAGNACSGYRLFAKLEDQSDPVIVELGCIPDCGVGNGYNYGISTGMPLNSGGSAGGPSPSPSPSSSPTSPPLFYACDNNGACNIWSGKTCPRIFDNQADCISQCPSHSEYWCTGN